MLRIPSLVHLPSGDAAVKTELIRVFPAWDPNTGIAMRVSAKMKDGVLLDTWGSLYSVSSLATNNIANVAAEAKVGGLSAWQPKPSDTAPYLQMEVPEGQVSAILTQGG